MQSIDYPAKEAFILEEEYVTIRKEDWPAINKAIDDAIAPLKPSGWRKALYELRQWGVLGATATIIVALFGIAAAAIYQATANVREETAFRTKTGDRLDAIESILHDLQRSQVAALLNSAAQEAKAGQKQNADGHIKQAADILPELAKTRVPAPASFFQSAVDTLDQLRATGANDANIHQASLRLAEYRSALNPAPSIPVQTAQLPENIYTNSLTLRISAYRVLTTINFSPPKPVTVEGNGAALDARGMRPDQEIMIPATRSLDENPIIIRNLTLIGANQNLDYITWENVTFVNTHIKYQGGPVRLRNVLFVDCTFDLPTNNLGTQLAEYAALQPKQELKMG